MAHAQYVLVFVLSHLALAAPGAGWLCSRSAHTQLHRCNRAAGAGCVTARSARCCPLCLTRNAVLGKWVTRAAPTPYVFFLFLCRASVNKVIHIKFTVTWKKKKEKKNSPLTDSQPKAGCSRTPTQFVRERNGLGIKYTASIFLYMTRSI
jgi:hypothetical protein